VQLMLQQTGDGPGAAVFRVGTSGDALVKQVLPTQGRTPHTDLWPRSVSGFQPSESCGCDV
jgi:hypothetical protein